jgi:hypothetical protein
LVILVLNSVLNKPFFTSTLSPSCSPPHRPSHRFAAFFLSASIDASPVARIASRRGCVRTETGSKSVASAGLDSEGQEHGSAHSAPIRKSCFLCLIFLAADAFIATYSFVA